MNNEQEQLLTMCTTWTMGNGHLLVMDRICTRNTVFGVFYFEDNLIFILFCQLIDIMM